jgi:hypothetical protein
MEAKVRADIRTLIVLLMVTGAAAGAQTGQPDSAAANRAALEAQFRQRMGEVTRQRLGASDEQMAKLQETNNKFDAQRRDLLDQERETRVALRKAMNRSDANSQAQIPALLDKVNAIQRQRIDIQAAEQKELSGYLSPMQRAQYFALEQQVRQRMNQMRQQAQGAQQGGRGGRAAGPLQGRGRAGKPPIKPR